MLLFFWYYVKRLERSLRVLVSWSDVEGKRKPICIHEQTKLNNRIRSVLLASAILSVSLGLLRLKEEVRAVIV